MREVNLPLDWQNCSLGDLLTGIQTGKSVRCDERPPQLQEKGLIKISAVTWGEFNENESKTLLSTDHLQSSHKIDIGDLLISRANTLELVGACVMVKNLSKNLYLSDKVLRLEINELLKPLVLRYLNSKDARIQIESLATGNQLSMRNISQDAIRAIRLPLPPLAEQKVIADKLDTLLAQVDNTKARLERIPEILKSFRQSVLAAAVSGKLAEDNAFKKRQLSSLKVLGKLTGGKTPSKSNARYWENGTIPWVSPKDMKSDFIDGSIDHITQLSLVEAGMRLLPEKTLLMVTRSGILAHSFPVALTTVPVTINQDIKAFIADTGKVRVDFCLYLIKGLEQRILNECSKAGTTVPSVETELLENLTFELPTLEEQTEIVRRVEEIFAYADRIEQAAQAALGRVNNLTQSILAKAFRGELTADWRAANPDLISGDNSAEALLAKIKAERAKLSKKAKA